MAATGSDLYEFGLKHVGEGYLFGAKVPKDNPGWAGPWDCAEFTSWCVFQASSRLYGCETDTAAPAFADAWTGYWRRDARELGNIVRVDVAAATKGAFLLRYPEARAIGHIVISDGTGGTVEAMGRNAGVCRGALASRRWDVGVLVPWIDYSQAPPTPPAVPPPMRLVRFGDRGAVVKRIQRALAAAGFHPGTADGQFGPHTLLAVQAFQAVRGLVADGEVGPVTAKSLKIRL